MNKKIVKEYKVGQAVFVRASGEKDIKWWPGIIREKKSAVTYLVWLNGKERFVHAGEIKENMTELEPKKRIKELETSESRKYQKRPFLTALLNSQNSNHNEREDGQAKITKVLLEDIREPQLKNHLQLNKIGVKRQFTFAQIL